MSWDAIIAVIALLTTIFGGLGIIITFSAKLGKMEFMLTTLWNAFIGGASAEAVNKGFMTMNSPVIPTMKTIETFTGTDLKHDLRDFYLSRGRYMTEQQLFSELTSIFGERITKEIAIPNKLHAGADILAAVSIAKGQKVAS